MFFLYINANLSICQAFFYFLRKDMQQILIIGCSLPPKYTIHLESFIITLWNMYYTLWNMYYNKKMTIKVKS